MVRNGSIYLRINKGVYKIPKVGLLANVELTTHLVKHKSYSVRKKSAMWQYESGYIMPKLALYNFSMQ